MVMMTFRFAPTTLFLLFGINIFCDASDDDTTSTCAYFLNEDSQTSYQPASYSNQEARPLCEDFSGAITFHRGADFCCTFITRINILDGNSGGFSVEYTVPIERGTAAESTEAATCYAYMDALSDTICSPDQGTYLSSTDNTFSVCQSSCDAVYEHCTNIINFGSGVTDGTTFCENAWNSKCDEYAAGYICGSELALNVASDNTGCISIVEPTEEVITFYEEHSASEETAGCAVRFFWVWITIAVLVLLCCCGLICCLCCGKK